MPFSPECTMKEWLANAKEVEGASVWVMVTCWTAPDAEVSTKERDTGWAISRRFETATWTSIDVVGASKRVSAGAGNGAG